MGDRHSVELQNKTSIQSHNEAFVCLKTQTRISDSGGQALAFSANRVCSLVLD